MTNSLSNADVLSAAAKAATLAPSVHNSQPWRFELHQDALDIFTDRSRWLHAIDPSGREMHISCGAAILFARLALRGMGHDVRTMLLPDPSDLRHVARVTLRGCSEPTEDERRLTEAIPLRHTDRGRYDNHPLPTAFVHALRVGVAQYYAWLRSIDTSGDETTTARLLGHADDVQRADPNYLAELQRWSRYHGNAADGIPRQSVRATPAAVRAGNYRLRDFNVDERAVVPDNAGGSTDEPLEVEHPTVVLLGTPEDDRRSWLEAGQALGWLLLTATASKISSAPMTQVLEVTGTRTQLRRGLRLTGYPQMLLRLGYGEGRPTTHRRPVAAVLTPGPRHA